MEHVLTLMSGPGGIAESVLAGARAALQEAGATPGATDWLEAPVACDIPFAGADPTAVETRRSTSPSSPPPAGAGACWPPTWNRPSSPGS